MKGDKTEEDNGDTHIRALARRRIARRKERRHEAASLIDERMLSCN
jgi:hypothetical protein